MCFFLTIAVPLQHTTRVREWMSPELKTHPTKNPSVMAALPPDYAAHLVTTGMCSCDLYACPESEKPKDRTAHLRQKYERLGWSKAKISRAIKQVESDSARAKKPLSGFRPDVVERAVAICRVTGNLAIVVHWYQGDVETESLRLRPVPKCNCDQLASRMQELREDEVLIV